MLMGSKRIYAVSMVPIRFFGTETEGWGYRVLHEGKKITEEGSLWVRKTMELSYLGSSTF